MIPVIPDVSCVREDIGPWLGSLGAFCGKWGNDDFVRGEWVRSSGSMFAELALAQQFS